MRGSELDDKAHTLSVDHHLAGMFEIHGDPARDVRLHLPQPPIGLARVAHQHAGFQHRIQIIDHFRGPFVMDDRHDFPAPELAELVGSRLCHDLVNPLSAISNGMELIDLSGAPRTPELDLIGGAIAEAMARIRFFRVAFGTARGDETLSERELRDILAAIYGTGRLSVDWHISGDLPRRDAKLAFLLLNCCETALPLGGTLTIRHESKGWEVTGEGRKLMIEPENWGLLDPPALSPTSPPPSRVQFALLAKEAGQRRLCLAQMPNPADQRVSVRVQPA